jgi:hypothetical protein
MGSPVRTRPAAAASEALQAHHHSSMLQAGWQGAAVGANKPGLRHVCAERAGWSDCMQWVCLPVATCTLSTHGIGQRVDTHNTHLRGSTTTSSASSSC